MTPSRFTLLAALAWIVIVPLAIANGLLREFVLTPRWGIHVAQPISGLLLILCIAGVAWLLVRRVGVQRRRTWLGVGCAWGAATFAFECLMLLISGRGLNGLIEQYTFAGNNIWPFVQAWTFIAPICLSTLRQHNRHQSRSQGKDDESQARPPVMPMIAGDGVTVIPATATSTKVNQHE